MASSGPPSPLLLSASPLSLLRHADSSDPLLLPPGNPMLCPETGVHPLGCSPGAWQEEITRKWPREVRNEAFLHSSYGVTSSVVKVRAPGPGCFGSPLANYPASLSPHFCTCKDGAGDGSTDLRGVREAQMM